MQVEDGKEVLENPLEKTSLEWRTYSCRSADSNKIVVKTNMIWRCGLDLTDLKWCLAAREFGEQAKKNVMGRACSTYGTRGAYRALQYFAGETWGKENTRKT
jgi:hypothetical protein